MAKEQVPQNHIEELRKARKVSARALAKAVGISTSYMSKLENGLSPVPLQLADKIAKELGVDANEVIDLPFTRKFTATCDEALLGSIIGWLLEAAEAQQVKISHQELSKWAGYIYNGTIEHKMNFQQTRFLSTTVVLAHKPQN